MARFQVEKPFQTKEEFVFETLREAILHLRLAPGEKLVVDHLSAELNVSPIPVRSALQRLEAEGLVRITPFAGAEVIEITPQEVAEVFAILEALERVAFEAASQSGNPQALARLEDILGRMGEAADHEDYESWSVLNRAFHLGVVGMSGNKLLADFTRRAFDRWDRLRRFFFPKGMQVRVLHAQSEHIRMVELLKSGDAKNLRTLVAEHNRTAREAYCIPQS
jgi:DNA-binding GntR family transcriptional regulator